MKLLPKKHFSWREPKPFLVVLDEHERSARRWWLQPLVLVIVCAFGLLTWYLARLNPTKHPPSFSAAVLWAIGLGILLAYFLPWFTTKLPSQIYVFDRYIVRCRGDNRHIYFSELTSFAWRFAPEFSTLIFTHRRGRQIFVGVPHHIPFEPLRTFLSERVSANRPNA